jgi:glutamyl-tRNA reductase
VPKLLVSMFLWFNLFCCAPSGRIQEALYLRWSVYPSMHASVNSAEVVNVRITHMTANVPLLEAVSFKDKKNALIQLRSLSKADECLILQTCNRVEIYLVSSNSNNAAQIASAYLADGAGVMARAAFSAVEVCHNRDCLLHLLRVACGLESMVVGEDQVINQVWSAYVEAEEAKTAGPILKQLFLKAVDVGRKVRKETSISKGAVSIGSAAVELANSLLDHFEEKSILVMGAGEMGTLVAKAMARRSLRPIFIANRTYDRALRLADELSGRAVKFDKLNEVLVDADVVICSTSAPHYILTKDLLSEIVAHRKNPNDLLIIDISNPRNVETTIEQVPRVKLYNIDDLHLIADRNKKERQKSIQEASKIISEELAIIQRLVKAESVRKLISDLLSQTEQVRQRELSKAFSIIGEVDEAKKKVIGDLTSILLKQTFVPLVENLRIAAMDSDEETIQVAVKLFKNNRKCSKEEERTNG